MLKPTLSVIISSRNRAAYLGLTLQSLIASNSPGFCEIIVVDNASEDETPQIVGDWKNKSSIPIHYFLETKLGLSHARNRGVQEAKGEIIAFIDDDAKAEPDWVSRLLEGYANNPHYQGGGGKVLLDWQDLKRPIWLTQIFLHSLSYFELPYSELTPIQKENDFVIGCNLSFRRQTFLQLGGFDPRLGRIGNSLQEGEEVDLQRKIIQSGGTLFYQPKAVVHHAVLSNKITKSFFYRFYLGKALTMLRNFQSQTNANKTKSFIHFSMRVPVWFFRTIFHLQQADQRFYCWLQMVMNLRAALYCLNLFTK